MRILTDKNKETIFKRHKSGRSYKLIAEQFGVEKHQIVETIKELEKNGFDKDAGYIPSEKFREIEKLENHIFGLITDYKLAKGKIKDMLSRRINDLKFRYSIAKID